MFTKSSPTAVAAGMNIPDELLLKDLSKTSYSTAADDPTHPFFGQGGSYSFDPATGQTTLLERSGQASEQTPPAPAQSSNPVSE